MCIYIYISTYINRLETIILSPERSGHLDCPTQMLQHSLMSTAAGERSFRTQKRRSFNEALSTCAGNRADLRG